MLYLTDIRKIQPEGPYLLGGYSFGGLVAYEMAQQLKAAGVETLDAAVVRHAEPAFRKSVRSPCRSGSRRSGELQGDGGFAGKLAGLAKRVVSGLVFRLKLERENRMAASSNATEGDHLRHVQSRLQHDALYDAYQPVPYDGATRLFIAQEGGGDKFAYEENLGWNGF